MGFILHSVSLPEATGFKRFCLNNDFPMKLPYLLGQTDRIPNQSKKFNISFIHDTTLPGVLISIRLSELHL